jgi:hypothetical protein
MTTKVTPALADIQPRNYIIDGDFTQWPEGTAQVGLASGQYGPAMWKYNENAGDVVSDFNRSTNVPTVAESGHQSTYSFEIDCTTAESVVGSTELMHTSYTISGSDFTHLHEQTITISFWHAHTKTGTWCGYLKNSAQDRTYLYEYTQTTTNTWEQHTVTIALDTSGTWLFTEADKGLIVGLSIFTGSGRQGTVDVWQAGAVEATSNQVDGFDSASNFFRIAQFGLYKGSTAPTFTAPPIATVKDQVDYYVQRTTPTGTNGDIAVMACNTTQQMQGPWHFTREMRKAPTMSASADATFRGHDGIGDNLLSSLAFSDVTTTKATMKAQTAGSWTDGNAGRLTRDSTDTTWIMADARH